MYKQFLLKATRRLFRCKYLTIKLSMFNTRGIYVNVAARDMWAPRPG